MLEKTSEARLKAAVENAGGMCIKMEPTLAGVPDRLVITPWGSVVWVEMKQDGGRVSRIQSSMHRRLRNLGQDVRVVYGRQGVDAFVHWMELIMEQQRLIAPDLLPKRGQ